jgi:predicted DCC family thiol-disulfide oxidoreductase YuxK
MKDQAELGSLSSRWATDDGTSGAGSRSRLPIVFYDGGCALCHREIGYYRRLDRAGRLVWVDISGPGAELERYGITREQAMARFHVLDGLGQWQAGAWGFAELWSHLPYFRALARLVRWLRLEAPADFVYRHFARWRLRRRCASGTCSSVGQQP